MYEADAFKHVLPDTIIINNNKSSPQSLVQLNLKTSEEEKDSGKNKHLLASVYSHANAQLTSTAFLVAVNDIWSEKDLQLLRFFSKVMFVP